MNELLFVVAIVTMIQGGQPVGIAMGFFYLRNDALYFVTRRHVARDETKGLKPDALRVRLHVDANNGGVRSKFCIFLMRKNQS